MVQPIWLGDLEAVLKEFPGLSIRSVEPDLVLAGDFDLSYQAKRFDSFSVEIHVSREFPRAEPKVYELGGRVVPGRHLNPSGDCCTGFYEVWRAKCPEGGLLDFMKGPVRDYFISQHEYERSGTWPFGELSHGTEGLFEGAAQLLGINNDRSLIVGYLEVLMLADADPALSCPCDSGETLDRCHGNDIRNLRAHISPELAADILRRLT